MLTPLLSTKEIILEPFSDETLEDATHEHESGHVEATTKVLEDIEIGHNLIVDAFEMEFRSGSLSTEDPPKGCAQ